MTTPQPPQQPYAQQPYPQQQYPQQPYPQQQAYAGVPAGYGPIAPARPGMVTAAAVLCFIWGGLAIIGALISMLGGAVVSSVGAACNSVGNLDSATSAACDDVAGSGGLLIFIGIALMVVAGLLIWGGVVALSGKNGKVSVIACGILIILEIVMMIAGGGATFSIVGIIVPVLIIVFLLNTGSRNWFRARGGATF